MTNNQSSVRVRMAPSPTGMLHVGTARTAIYNYLFAKHNHGQFILRIEDTDLDRSNKKFEEDIIDGLKWLGITSDEPIIRQTDRVEIYQQFLEKLLASGKAFFCAHTIEELDKERKLQMASHMSPHHICDARNNSFKKGIIRLRNDQTDHIVFEDIVRGAISFDPQMFGDLSLAKDIKTPLYNFAVVVDDNDMRISHVIRGEDHIANTPKQILIQRALDIDMPKYAHISLLLGTDRSKLSKRHGATSISQYRSDGYLSEALFNYLALLGWNSGTNQEIFSLDELNKEFSLEKVQKAGAIFDVVKLDWINGEYIRKKSLSDLRLLAKPYITKFSYGSDKFIENILALEQPRLKKLSELTNQIDYFFDDPKYDPSLLIWKEVSREDVKNALLHAQNIIENILEENWNKEYIEKIFLKECETYKNRGELLWPLRVALSGKKASPGPFDILYVLWKKPSIKRIQKALEML